MTHNDLEWLFHVKLDFVVAVLDSVGSTFKDNCVKSNKYRPKILSAAKI